MKRQIPSARRRASTTAATRGSGKFVTEPVIARVSRLLKPLAEETGTTVDEQILRAITCYLDMLIEIYSAERARRASRQR